MELGEGAPGVQALRHHVELAPNHVEVGQGTLHVGRDDHVAGAEEAAVGAEGQVDVDREGVMGGLVRPPEAF